MTDFAECCTACPAMLACQGGVEGGVYTCQLCSRRYFTCTKNSTPSGESEEWRFIPGVPGDCPKTKNGSMELVCFWCEARFDAYRRVEREIKSGSPLG